MEINLKPLDGQQTLFCSQYLVDFNGTLAAMRAGYKPKGARTTASRLLTRDNIRAEISRLTAEQAKRTAITADRVIAEIALIAFARMSHFFRIDHDGQPQIEL